MTVHKLVPLFALALNLLLIGFALSSDRKSPLTRAFAYFGAAQALWNFGVLGLRWSQDPVAALLWEVVVHVGVIPLPVLFYRYVVVFLELPARPTSLLAGYGLCAFFLAVSGTSLFMRDVQHTYWGWAPVSGPLYAPFFVYFQLFMVLGLVRLVRARRRQTSSFWRSRMLLVILGVALSLVGGAVDFLRFILKLERLYPVGIPANSILALALGLAIVRYRMLDVAVLARRLMLYLLTSVALAPVLILGLHLIDRVVPEPSVVRNVIEGLVLLLAFSLALPLLRLLEPVLERIMFSRQHGVREVLLALSKEMTAILDVRTLGEALTARLVTRVPVARASLYLYDRDSRRLAPFARTVSPALEAAAGDDRLDLAFARWLEHTRRTLVVGEAALQSTSDLAARALVRELEARRVALLVPMFLEGELSAVLLLGEKLSGDLFDAGEIEMLEMLMGQTAIALKNARLYEDLRVQMNELRTTQQQLLQSAKLAAIGELAASVAHEINNPLTVILGSSALLLKKTPSESAAYAKITNIIGAANRAAKIVRDLLDFSRRREPKHEPLELEDLLTRSLDIVQVRLASAGVQVRTNFDGRVPAIVGDRDQLTQVFINLFGNAVDAMAGGGTLTVRMELLRESGLVAVDVTDTGSGMDQAQIARIFEPFFTTKGEGRGTGLGLSVSLGIVSKHGGSIEVRSEPGQGTTMRVKLPTQRGLPRADHDADAAATAPALGRA